MDRRSQPRPKLTAAQAGEHMGLTGRQVLELVRRGQLPHIRYSARIVRFELDDIEAWCEARKQGPATPESSSREPGSRLRSVAAPKGCD